MSIAPLGTSTPLIQPTVSASTGNTNAIAAQATSQYKDITPREEMNAQLVSGLDVSLSAGSNPQLLLYRSAIDKINEYLAPDLGADALQNAAANQDNSAEATAKRILDMTTSMYGAYAEQHPEMSKEELAKGFVDVIRGGFETGFNDAKDILKGLKVLEGDVASGIQRTYDLVQKGFDDFLAAKLAENSDSTTGDNSAA